MTLLLLQSVNNKTGGGERERASASPNKGPAHRPWLNPEYESTLCLSGQCKAIECPTI